MRRIRLGFYSALLILAALILVPSATAMASAQGQETMHTLRAGMTFVPVMRILGQTPGKAGYFTALAANGKQAIIPDALESSVRSRMEQRGVITNSITDTVYGNCGSSFITLETKPNGDPIRTVTGFTVIGPEVDYNWMTGRSGPNYPAYNREWSGFESSNTWKGTWDSVSNYPHGTWSGAVYPYYSWVIFTEGSMEGQICYSGGPAVSGHV